MTDLKKYFKSMCEVDTVGFPSIPELIEFNPETWEAEVQLNKSNEVKIKALFAQVKNIQEKIKLTFNELVRERQWQPRPFLNTEFFVKAAKNYIKKETDLDVE